MTVYHDVYEWVYEYEPTGQVPYHPPYEVTTQSSHLVYFKMNWGYGNNYGEDNGNYSIDGSWSNPLIPNSNPYVYTREIFSRFR